MPCRPAAASLPGLPGFPTSGPGFPASGPGFPASGPGSPVVPPAAVLAGPARCFQLPGWFRLFPQGARNAPPVPRRRDPQQAFDAQHAGACAHLGQSHRRFAAVEALLT
ncbi:hypothetical protein GCM10010515_30140 [Streptomyces fructofermentans]|uniref:Uncharacterized protein n=1 Tax=Streptomyces fructofermentans TaxID=152141 RepID=A0A918KE41_9ACTN|nr:hypothetical protein GCM10010515_30140 [Streptomyces fructofermentans]